MTGVRQRLPIPARLPDLPSVVSSVRLVRRLHERQPHGGELRLEVQVASCYIDARSRMPALQGTRPRQRTGHLARRGQTRQGDHQREAQCAQRLPTRRRQPAHLPARAELTEPFAQLLTPEWETVTRDAQNAPDAPGGASAPRTLAETPLAQRRPGTPVRADQRVTRGETKHPDHDLVGVGSHETGLVELTGFEHVAP